MHRRHRALATRGYKAVWFDPSHEKCGRDEQEYPDRQGYSQGEKFNGPVSGFTVFDQGEQAGSHAQNDQQKHDGDNDFDQGETRMPCILRQILPDRGNWLP